MSGSVGGEAGAIPACPILFEDHYFRGVDLPKSYFASGHPPPLRRFSVVAAHLLTSQPTYPPACLPSVDSFVCISTYIPTCQLTHLLTCVSIYLFVFVHLLAYLLTDLIIYLSIDLSIHLSIYLFVLRSIELLTNLSTCLLTYLLTHRPSSPLCSLPCALCHAPLSSPFL